MEIGLGYLGQAVVILEIVMELFIIRYPFNVLRFLVHSLLCSHGAQIGAQIARVVFREWHLSAVMGNAR